MKTIICVFAALCLINISLASDPIISPLSCEHLPAMPNFNKERKNGMWYVYETRFTSDFDNAACWTEHFNSTGYTLQEEDFYRDLENDTNATVTGLYTYSKPGFGLYSDQYASYTILSTDYINYSVEIYCADYGDHSERYVLILSRSRTVTPTTQRKIDKILADNSIDKATLRKVMQDQKICEPKPAPAPPLNGLGRLLQTLLSLLL